MNIHLEEHLRSIASPANLVINDQIKRYREQCRINGCTRPYHHFAFGQSPFPPPPPVVAALTNSAAKHDYLPTAGLPELRETIAHFYNYHFNLSCLPAQVIVSPGSKEMIAMILAVIQGSVLIPTPSWVSYLPQAKILRKEVISLRTRPEENYKLTPDLLIQGAQQSENQRKILILNHPNNPTGTSYSKSELIDLAKVCRKFNIVVIADEIYALTGFEPDRFVSMGKVFPEGTIITGGLSKDRSAGGYRLGVGIFPQGQPELLQNLLKIAGSTYSCVAAPIQYAAIKAYSLDSEVETYMRDCREVNAMVGRKTALLVSDIVGLTTSQPQGAFYLYVDFNEQKERFLQVGLKTCIDFARHLLKVEHTALLPGSALLLPEDDFSVRFSYVDYDGETVLSKWRKNPPKTNEEEDYFIQKYCPLITDGVKNIALYLEQIRLGKLPRHR